MNSEINIAKLEEEGGAEKSQKFALKWIAISIAVGLLIWLLPTPEALGARGHAFLALLAVIVLLWTSEAIPIGVTSILAGCGHDHFQYPARQGGLGTLCQPDRGLCFLHHHARGHAGPDHACPTGLMSLYPENRRYQCQAAQFHPVHGRDLSGGVDP